MTPPAGGRAAVYLAVCGDYGEGEDASTCAVFSGLLDAEEHARSLGGDYRMVLRLTLDDASSRSSVGPPGDERIVYYGEFR